MRTDDHGLLRSGGFRRFGLLASYSPPPATLLLHGKAHEIPDGLCDLLTDILEKTLTIGLQ